MNNEFIINHLKNSANTKNLLATNEDTLTNILQASDVIAQAFMSNPRKKLMICGNGGSAADSQHIAAEFTSVLSMDVPRPGLPALALTTDSSFLTANANDYGFDGIYERQVQALGCSGDVILGISTSGNSENIIKAFQLAKGMGVKTILFSGETGGKLIEFTDIPILVPSNSVQHIQECHITLGHIICELVEKALGYD